MQEKKSLTFPLIGLLVLIVIGAGVWKFYTIDHVEIVGTSEVGEVKESCPIPAPSVEVKQTEEIGTQVVVLDGQGIGQITVNDPAFESEAHVFLKRPCNAWIVASATGRGGYILYGGDDQLYQLDFSEKTLTRVPFDGFMTDLSSDETLVASVTTIDDDAGSQPSIEITGTAKGNLRAEYPVPAPYNDAGSAKFSPDGTKIAYGATERNADGDPVSAAVYVIDLATGNQSLYSTDFAKGTAAYVAQWKNNTDIIVSEQP